MFKTGWVAVAAVVVLALSGCASAGASAGESDYLTSVKGVWYGTVPTDADLIGYGKKACESLAAGDDMFYLAILPGATGEKVSYEATETDKNNWHVVAFATALCPKVIAVSSVVLG